MGADNRKFSIKNHISRIIDKQNLSNRNRNDLQNHLSITNNIIVATDKSSTTKPLKVDWAP